MPDCICGINGIDLDGHECLPVMKNRWQAALRRFDEERARVLLIIDKARFGEIDSDLRAIASWIKSGDTPEAKPLTPAAVLDKEALITAMIEQSTTTDLQRQLMNILWNEAQRSGHTARFFAKMIYNLQTEAEREASAASYDLGVK